jgi:hypothetical protein
MSNINKNIEEKIAYDKALAIINSCMICEQFENALLFIELYLKQFNNIEKYNELINSFKCKKIELNCYE